MGITIDEVIESARTMFKNDSIVMKMTEKKIKKIAVQKTGLPQLDVALGVGGIPKGRIIEIYGPESCLYEFTFIQYNIRNKDGKVVNHKGGFINRLYERFHNLKSTGRGKARKCDLSDKYFTTSSVNEFGRIIQNKILDVVKTGKKECFKLTTKNGLNIIATADHKFYNGIEFLKLSDIKIGDLIKVHTNKNYESSFKRKRIENPVCGLKWHPIAGIRTINGCEFCRIGLHRAVIEANMNNISLEEYIERLNLKNIDGMKFLTRNQHVHHIDGNKLNNDINNLIIVSNSEHRKLHSKEIANNLAFEITDDIVESIISVGEKETFDIKMQSPYNNFIANKFVVHNSGKTTLALTIIAEAQKNSGSWAWYGDMEHALDPEWAMKLGVNMDKLLISQPDHGEQCLELTKHFIKTGVIDIVVVDSVASLVPQAELEGDMTSQHMGLQARLMSKAMRKLTGIISKTECTAFFINQIRDKIGVKWGCFDYDSRICLADGTTEKIGKIVNQKLDLKVLSVNKESKKIEPKNIIGWFNNGIEDNFLEFTTTAPNKRGHNNFRVTDNHKMILLENNKFIEKNAKDFNVGDYLLTFDSYKDSEYFNDLLIGSMLGDGSLRKISYYKSGFRLGHCKEQEDYIKWKFGLFEPIIGGKLKQENYTKVFRYESNADIRLEKYRNKICNCNDKFKNDWFGFKDCGLLALAIWYLDDGTYGLTKEIWGAGRTSICSTLMNKDQLDCAAQWIEKLGIKKPDVKIGKGLFFNGGEQTFSFHNTISKYVPKCMHYKLHSKFCAIPKIDIRSEIEIINKLIPSKILKKEKNYRDTKGRKRYKYDLEIEDNHNYIVGGSNGVIVHNSPETTPGGKALKFYCSVRLDVRKVGDIGKKEESIGCTIKINVKKNKVAPPFRICEASLLYDKGFDISTNLFEAGLMFGVIEKSGKTFTFKLDEEIITLGIGKNNAKDGVVALSKEVREKLYDLIVKKGIEKGSLVNLDESEDSEDKVNELEKEIKGEKIELVAEE